MAGRRKGDLDVRGDVQGDVWGDEDIYLRLSTLFGQLPFLQRRFNLSGGFCLSFLLLLLLLLLLLSLSAVIALFWNL